MGCRLRPDRSHQPQSLQYLSLRNYRPKVNLPIRLGCCFCCLSSPKGICCCLAFAAQRLQPLANFPRRSDSIPKDRLVHYRSPFTTLAPDAAANGAGYADETGAEQKEAIGFGDRGDGKGDGLIVGMLSIRSENICVGAGGGEIAL
jgi:hypothetical protein